MSPARLVAVLVLPLCTALAYAQTETPEPRAGEASATDGRTPDTLVVATKSAPPFAMQSGDDWSGLSIALWRHVANDLGVDYRFEAVSLDALVDGVASGRYDVSVAATTITPERERSVDFSHPFYTTGFGVVIRSGEDSWWKTVSRLLSAEFLGFVALLVLLLATIGFLFWLVERRHNPDEFRRNLPEGLGDGFWFSAVTMTTVGYGDMAPRSWGGRALALVWMFSALVIVSTFTGFVASTLTAERLESSIARPGDLATLRVGSVPGTSSEGWLARQGLGFRHFDSLEAGLDAVARGEVEAFVYDRPLLRHLVTQDDEARFVLAPVAFGRQDYGIALPNGSPLREALNRSLLEYLSSDAWQALRLRYLGEEG